jgi:hypothetical protein
MTNVPPSQNRSSDYLEMVPNRKRGHRNTRGIVIHLRSAFPADAIFYYIDTADVPGLAAKDIIEHLGDGLIIGLRRCRSSGPNRFF